MYPQEFVPPDIAKLRDQGNVRHVVHGPMTVEAVLERGLAAMDDEDELERLRASPVRYLGVHRSRPRRRLLDIIFRGRTQKWI